MRAQVFHGPGDLRLEEIPVPEPDAGGLVVRVQAALTCGTDVKTLRRGHPVMIPHVPTVFGHELAGMVTAVGRGVRGHPGGRPGRRGQLGPLRALPALRGGPAQPLRGPALRQRRLRRVHRAAPAAGRPQHGPDRRRPGRVERGLRRAAGLRPARDRAGPGRAGHDGGDLRPRPARLPAGPRGPRSAGPAWCSWARRAGGSTGCGPWASATAWTPAMSRTWAHTSGG